MKLNSVAAIWRELASNRIQENGAAFAVVDLPMLTNVIGKRSRKRGKNDMEKLETNKLLCARIRKLEKDVKELQDAINLIIREINCRGGLS